MMITFMELYTFTLISMSLAHSLSQKRVKKNIKKKRYEELCLKVSQLLFYVLGLLGV